MDGSESSDILVVDDNATIRAVLSDLLTEWGYRVRTAADGRAALAAIAERQPDLIVLDAVMPEMDGYAVCEVLRRGGNDVPVVLLTGQGDAARGLAVGADDFLVKPPKPQELAVRVQKLRRLRGLQKMVEEKNRELEHKNCQLQAQNAELAAMAGQLEAQNQQLRVLTEELRAQNEEREAMAGQLEAQNHQLLALTDALRAQNDELEAMASQMEAQNQQLVAMADQLQAANGHLAQLSVTDGLTGAHNHRHFQERLREELARASRQGTPLSCVLLDIDWFKQVNDTYGHLAGDRVLVGLVEILRQSVREEDVVCRYGGEEFALLLPAITPDNARALAERLRETVAATAFPLPGGSCLSITVSAGVVGCSSGELVPGPLAFVGGADQALLRAKQHGRNRVEQGASPGSGDRLRRLEPVGRMGPPWTPV